MKPLILLIIVAVISSCASLHSDDPNSMFFSIPEGSTLSLNNEMALSHKVTHGLIQFGKEITDKDRDFFDINCRLDFKKFGPRTIEPETFTITRTIDGQNWIAEPTRLRFYTKVYLASNKDTDVIKMVCQIYGDPSDRNFTVAEMQTALGDFITINYATAK